MQLRSVAWQPSLPRSSNFCNSYLPIARANAARTCRMQASASHLLVILASWLEFAGCKCGSKGREARESGLVWNACQTIFALQQLGKAERNADMCCLLCRYWRPRLRQARRRKQTGLGAAAREGLMNKCRVQPWIKDRDQPLSELLLHTFSFDKGCLVVRGVCTLARAWNARCALAEVPSCSAKAMDVSKQLRRRGWGSTTSDH